VKANVVRLATVVAGLVSVVVAFVDRLPTDIPAYAFGDASVLRAERGLALLAILFIAFVVLWRGVVEGELPIEISREGFKYQQREVARDTAATIQGLEASVERQRSLINQLQRVLSHTVGVVESQGSHLARLEVGGKEGPPNDQTPS
jgi:hypothetical protein